MNGKQLLEAMGYADERYIRESDRPVRPRSAPWKGLAAMAACFCLILLAARYGLPVFQAAGTKDASPESSVSAVYQAPAIGVDTVTSQERIELMDGTPEMEAAAADDRGLSAVSGSALMPVSMTVRVDSREDGFLLCTVIDPGTSAYPAEAQVKLAPPETEAEKDISAVSRKEPVHLLVTFLPADSDGIIPLLTMTYAD